MSALVFDLESVAIDSAAEFIEPATAPANYVKKEAIDAFIAKANAEAVAKAALDVDLARIVAIGWSGGTETYVEVAKNETDETKLLTEFWDAATAGWHNINDRPLLVGFNCLFFDLVLMLRRSLYLGVPAPKLPINKYRHPGIEDLMLSLSFDGALRYRSLAFYIKRFGLDVPADPHNGSDIAGLVAAGDFDAVAAHCRADVSTTVALAKRMGVL